MRRRSLLALALPALLAACAAPRPPGEGAGPRWSGRLALRVGPEGEPGTQSFSAGFELRGSPAAGALELITPLGSTAALLEWSAAGARLRAAGQPERRAASLDALVREATGTPLPLAALFDWLAGRPTPVDGWQADLSQHAQGRLQARRLAPPLADLRLLLDSPTP